tara:strand:+ start:312 stop:548 length:237 start_codon:yes stop_codon:yes gene_type:complete
MQHNKESIYRKIDLNATVIPGEWEIIIKDIHYRLKAVEEQLIECQKCTTPEEGGRELEKPASNRRGTRKVSKKKVSPS